MALAGMLLQVAILRGLRVFSLAAKSTNEEESKVDHSSSAEQYRLVFNMRR